MDALQKMSSSCGVDNFQKGDFILSLFCCQDLTQRQKMYRALLNKKHASWNGTMK